MTSTQDLPSIIIDPEGDLVVRLFTLENLAVNEQFKSALDGKLRPGRLLATLTVSREILTINSPFFEAMFAGEWAESTRNIVDIEGKHVPSAEIWFRTFHGSELPSELIEIKIWEVWEVIQYGSYLQSERTGNVDFSELEIWFDRVLKRFDIKALDEMDRRMLLYPCFVFDNARGFAMLTKCLAYETPDHITEYNPTVYGWLHLDSHLIGKINGARGSIRCKMIRGLFDPISGFLNTDCVCKKDSLWFYLKGISKTGMWPMHDQYKKSIQQVLDSRGFMNFECEEIPEKACESCLARMDKKGVDSVRHQTATEFDGLCLDCINLTKFGNVDDDYWLHDLHRQWDQGCRVKHGQPTWYFSFLGRKAEMKDHQLEMKNTHRRKRVRFSF